MPEQAAGVLLGTARGAAGWQVLVVWECETTPKPWERGLKVSSARALDFR